MQWLQWDAMLPGRSVQSRVNVTKGKDRANCVTIYVNAKSLYAVIIARPIDLRRNQRFRVADTARPLPPLASQAAAEDKHGGKWILQDSCTGPCESVLAYAPVDAALLRPVIDGRDSSSVALLPCGFAVAPDGLGTRAAVITSSKKGDEDRAAAGSLVTVAFQALAATTTGDALPPDPVATVTGLVACTLGNIKKALRCEDC